MEYQCGAVGTGVRKDFSDDDVVITRIVYLAGCAVESSQDVSQYRHRIPRDLEVDTVVA